DENKEEAEKYLDLAKKALTAGNEDDAKVFLEKKTALEAIGADLTKAYDAAHGNAEKMRELHDKLTADISSLKARRDAVKAKTSVAKTQEKINKIGASADKMQGAMGAFERMEEKADKMLDSATAAAELDSAPQDSAAELEKKYTTNAAVDSQLEELKKSMGML
ncbi:MAG: PspA/IM30 family protein, partial [Oscillospiraceae bacterium]